MTEKTLQVIKDCSEAKDITLVVIGNRQGLI